MSGSTTIFSEGGFDVLGCPEPRSFAEELAARILVEQPASESLVGLPSALKLKVDMF